MSPFYISSRRSFLERGLKIGTLAALNSLMDIPLVAKRALAADMPTTLGRNGKKLLFVFLRGGNDALNSVIPVQDPAYYTSRPTTGIGIPKDSIDYSAAGPCDVPVIAPTAPTYSYQNAIRLGNGFSALHPSLKFLAPLYNSGDLALVHRVGYPKQSRSHFDSQIFWETGNPSNNLSKEGIFYRTILESGLAQTAPLTAVSIQSSLPLILRGSQAAMTNLSDPNRFNLLGVPNGTGDAKADAALRKANGFLFPDKKNRGLLSLQYQNLLDTLGIFQDLQSKQLFDESGNTYQDSQATDGDVPYHLFPTTNAKNGGYAAHANDPAKYVVNPRHYDFFTNLKAAATVLNKTDAVIAGTQLDGFDTHSTQGGVTGTHSDLQRAIGWSMFALKKYFTQYADKVNWSNVIVITLSEFGRTTVMNSDVGTDHAEAGLMFVAGGGVKGYGKNGNLSGVFGGNPSDSIRWETGSTGSMFKIDGRYLRRAIDYRSVLGRIIREHLGATQEQLNRIIPGYAVSGERLLSGGISSRDGTQIMGEVPVV
jgi:uncharacterized protein (DUF1501 family)